MEKQLTDKIKECKARIVANSKDAHFAETLIGELIGLQKQADIEPVELVVPKAEVLGEWDGGAVRIVKTVRGYLFEAKGGLSTFVDNRMASVSEMCSFSYETLKDEGKDENGDEVTAATAITTVLQAPIFCSLDQGLLYSTASHILEGFNEITHSLDGIALKPETEEDINANNEAEKLQTGLDLIVNSTPGM